MNDATSHVHDGYVHRIVVRSRKGAEEAQRRLAAHGHDATIFDETTPDWPYFALHLASPFRDLDLDFLRPDILPPR